MEQRLFNVFLKHPDGSTTEYLNLEEDRVPGLLADLHGQDLTVRVVKA